jgi:Secretion system C-terminal sorting domain
MKKTITLFFALTLSVFVFAQDTIVAWTFPSTSLDDTIADVSNTLNQSQFIYTVGGTDTIVMKNGLTTKAAQTTGWDNGMNTKAWQVEVITTGYDSIKVSSKQSAGATNAGPQHWRVQYSVDGGTSWNNVIPDTLFLANDFTTGVVDNEMLPASCFNQASVLIQWIMISNIDIYGATMLPAGGTKIDDIYFTGVTTTVGIEQQETVSCKLFPNPCTDVVNMESTEEIDRVEVYNILGAKVFEADVNAKTYQIAMDYENGFYTIVSYSKGKASINKIIVQ